MNKLDDSMKNALIWEVQEKAVDLFLRRWKFRLGLAVAVAAMAVAVIGFRLTPWMDGVATSALQAKIAEMSEAESGAIRQIKLEQAIALKSLVGVIEQARVEADRALEEVKKLAPEVQDEAARLEQTRQSLDNIVKSLTYLQKNTDKLPVVAKALRSMEGGGLDHEGRLQKLEGDTGPIAIDCPSPRPIYDQANSSYDVDLYTCTVRIPNDGFVFLSLQGHVRTNQVGSGCSFSIFVNGEDINTASRQLPSYTDTTSWSPAFMADTLQVKRGTLAVGPRLSGVNCSIHDPDINGVLFPAK